MTLVFNEIIHLVLSLLIGLTVWKVWKKKYLFGVALIGGFFVDVDHLIDYFLAFGFKFNLTSFFRGDQFLVSDKLYLLFHGWEYLIVIVILILIIKNKIFQIVILTFGISLGLHLTWDVNTNDGMTIKSYSLIYRATNNFEMKRIVTSKHFQKHQKLKERLNYEK